VEIFSNNLIFRKQIHGGKGKRECGLLTSMDARFRHAGMTTKWRNKVLRYIKNLLNVGVTFPRPLGVLRTQC
jgi:hypothetical protein